MLTDSFRSIQHAVCRLDVVVCWEVPHDEACASAATHEVELADITEKGAGGAMLRRTCPGRAQECCVGEGLLPGSMYMVSSPMVILAGPWQGEGKHQSAKCQPGCHPG